MKKRHRRVLASHLENLLVHLLKWQYQPSKRQIGYSLVCSIRAARHQLVAGLMHGYGASQQFQDSHVQCYRAAGYVAGARPAYPPGALSRGVPVVAGAAPGARLFP